MIDFKYNNSGNASKYFQTITTQSVWMKQVKIILKKQMTNRK